MIEKLENGLRLRGGSSSLSATVVFGVPLGLVFCLVLLGPFFLRAWLVLTFVFVPFVWLLSKAGRNEVMLDDFKGAINRGYFPLPYDKVKSVTIVVSAEKFSISANGRIGLVQSLPLSEMREVRQELDGRFPEVRVTEAKRWGPFIKVAGLLLAFYIVFVLPMDSSNPPVLSMVDFPEVRSDPAFEHTVGDFILSLPESYIAVDGGAELPIFDAQSGCRVINGPEFFYPGDDIVSRVRRKNISLVTGADNYYDLLNMAVKSWFGLVPLFLRSAIVDSKEAAYGFENDILRGLIVVSTMKGKRVEVLALEAKHGGPSLALRSICKGEEPTVFRSMKWGIRPR